MSSSKYPLRYLIREPKSVGHEKVTTLFLLHGRAARAETIFSIEGFLDPSFRIIAINAPYESPKGEYEWFLPYDYDHPLESFSEAHFAESESILTDQIIAMSGELNINMDTTFIGGFSQGAAMSHILALHGRLNPRGILAMSGFFPRPLMSTKPPEKAPTFLITHGSEDNVLPIAESFFALNFLQSIGISCAFYEYKGRHKMTTSMLQFVNGWVSKQTEQNE